MLGIVIKLASKTLSFEAYVLLANKVQAFQGESFVGMKTFVSVLANLQFGIFERKQN